MHTSGFARFALVATLCGSAAAWAADPVKLSKDEVQKALSRKSITYAGRSGGQILMFFAADGHLTSRTLTNSLTSQGNWTVDDEGHFCVKFISGRANDSCRFLFKTDEGYAVSNSSGKSMIAIDKIE